MAQKGKRGFASMDREKQRRIASMGGRAAHQKGTAHEFTSEEAREAGRKGGQAALERRKAQAMTASEPRQAGREREADSENRERLVNRPEEPVAEEESLEEHRELINEQTERELAYQ